MFDLDDGDIVMIRLELRACCSPEVNKFLFEYVGASKLDASTETEMLNHIKSVAVKTVHKEVHTLAFNAMKQEKGESITHFVGRLMSKAFLCEFEIECTSHAPPIKLSYAEKNDRAAANRRSAQPGASATCSLRGCCTNNSGGQSRTPAGP